MTDSCKDTKILDLSKKSLKKIPKDDDAQNIHVLILDDNDLQKVDNIDSYIRIEKLSLSKNQLSRMYGICRLHNLRELNLSFNGIVTIEGLKELVLLTHLNLEGNNIKTIEHLNNNVKLEYLNLSHNSLGSISDLSFLKCLEELYLHGNRITHLKQCDKYLPTSLKVLTLAENSIDDLNEICTLTHLCNLHTISINDNPCVKRTEQSIGFDYRPFVLNWCMSVKVIDGFLVDPIESLKAEWLYSQGKGRQFRVGDQDALAKYLSSVCPLLGKALENENERKLRLILSKAQQHQRQLQEEISSSLSVSENSSLKVRKKHSGGIQSPRFIKDQQLTTTNNNGPLIAASKMVPVPESLISPDCCPTIVSQCMPVNTSSSETQTQNICMRSNINEDSKCNSLISNSPDLKQNEKFANLNNTEIASKFNTSDNLQQNMLIKQNQRLVSNCIDVGISEGTISSDDDSEHINLDKLKTIRNMAVQRTQINKDDSAKSSIDINNEAELSAIVIQKVWRGYLTRKKSKFISEKLLQNRLQDYIEKLNKDMEITKAQLENERKIQQLQMHAINALWKKVSLMQPTTKETEKCEKENNTALTDFTKTCSMLMEQVQQLQHSMQDILKCMTVFCNLGPENIKNACINCNNIQKCAATQTEIIAVHTPNLENSNCNLLKARPSSLALQSVGNVSKEKSENIADETKIDDFTEKINHHASSTENNDAEAQNDNNKLNIENVMHISSDKKS